MTYAALDPTTAPWSPKHVRNIAKSGFSLSRQASSGSTLHDVVVKNRLSSAHVIPSALPSQLPHLQSSIASFIEHSTSDSHTRQPNSAVPFWRPDRYAAKRQRPARGSRTLKESNSGICESSSLVPMYDAAAPPTLLVAGFMEHVHSSFLPALLPSSRAPATERHRLAANESSGVVANKRPRSSIPHYVVCTTTYAALFGHHMGQSVPACEADLRAYRSVAFDRRLGPNSSG